MARHTAKSHKIRKVEILVIQIHIFMKVYAKIKTIQLIVKEMPYSDILNNFKT